MSSQLRMDLGRTLGHARRHHGAYMEFKTNYPAPWTDLQKAQAETLQSRMKDDIKSFEKYFTKWINLVERIQNDDEYNAESNLYNQWMNNPDYDGMICDLKDFCAEIASFMDLMVSSPRRDRTPGAGEISNPRMDRTSRVVVSRSDMSLASTQWTEVHDNDDGVGVQRTDTHGGGTVALRPHESFKVCETLPFAYGSAPSSLMPVLNITKFSGDSIKWKAFWQRFDLNVHSRPYPDIQKMDILLGLLEGRALEEVEGFELSAENYDSVVQILRERFGNNDLIINQLQANLRGLKVAAQNSDSLRTTVNTINNMCRQLKNFGVDVENASLRLDIIDKMPPREKGELKWLLVSAPGTTTEALLKKMNEFAWKAEVLEQERKGGSSPSGTSNVPTSVKALPSNGSSSKKFMCTYCDGNHKSAVCQKLTTVEEKIKCLKDKHYCSKCASKNHETKSCDRNIKCRNCNEQHYAFLCPKRITSLVDLNKTKYYVFVEKKQGNLLTKQVTVVNPETKKTMDVIALFDSGSQRSYASDQLIGQLKLPVANVEKLSVEGFGGRSTVYNAKLVELRVKTTDGHKDVYASSTKKIADAIPVIESEGFGFDKIVTTNKKPDLLIGMDYFFEFITSFEKTKNNLYVVESKVGQMLASKAPHSHKTIASVAIEPPAQIPEPDESYHDFWKLESMGINDVPSASDEDKQALEKFAKTAKFKDNRFYVSWPVKDNHKPLPSNAGLALGRLRSTMKKLSLNPEQLKAYQDIIEKQVQNGTIEVAPKIPEGKIVHYLSHHAVVTSDKATTKVRMVFDASAKISKHAPSLNDCLIRGPVNLPDLCGLLLRIRTSKYLLIGDIEKAFHQVYLNESDRDAVRFFWVKDPLKPAEDDNLIVYRFVGVPFGVITSPFLLMLCIHVLLQQLDDQKLKSIERNNYVDNMFIFADDPKDGIKQFEVIKDHFLKASMKIREWLSNSSEIMNAIPDGLKQKTTVTKVLGLQWDSMNDTLEVELKNDKHVETWTKRNVLKFIASSFDPLGFVSPVTVKGRIFMQKLFKQGLNWDQPLPVDLLEEWTLIFCDWKGVIRISRKFTVDKLPYADKIEIHCFADASKDAYCACIYLRIPSASGFETPLVFAKTRLLPLSKNSTIPKMEIMGIWLASKIGSFVAKELKLEDSTKYIWTDSQISFWWFQKWPKDVFVSNRLKEVVASKAECMFVPGKLNPADLGTRGISFDELHKTHCWLHGPKFLKEPHDKWPKPPNDVTQTITALVAIAEAEPTSNFLNVEVRREFEIDKSLTWTELKNDVALKQKQACEDGNTTLNIDDLATAEKALIIQEQRMYLTSKLKTDLKLSKDEHGIYRINCRFDHAELINAHPIFLPKDSPLAQVVILDVHERLHHAGVPHTLAKIRETYWIPCGRNTVKKILQRCGNCKMWKGKPFALPKMPTLPASRVYKSKPFESTGVDYCGPFKVKGKDEKAWVLVFTCFTTRLIHLEPVCSMTSEDFLMSFRRFIARRGVPQYILSDNGKQFKTASTALDELWSKTIVDTQAIQYCNREGITWDFITERAPWKGGLYERLVALIKNALKQVIGRRFVNFNEFWTFLTEVESSLNSRPLTYVHAEEPFIIRPIDFVSPHLQISLPTNLSDDQSSDATYLPSNAGGGERLVERYYKTVEYLDKFWKLWSEHYLNLLRERNDDQHKNRRGAIQRSPEVNETVLVFEPDQPRGIWKSANIINLIKSTDGEIRSAEIKYKGGFVTRRAINQLYPVEESSIPSEPIANSTMLDS